MLGRNISTRVEKLEALHRRDDEMLMLWRQLGTDVAETVAARQAGLFQPGDLVLSAEWLGAGDPPKPAWYRDFPSGLTEEAARSCWAAVEKLASSDSIERAAPTAHLSEVPDGQLWHAALGVQT